METVPTLIVLAKLCGEDKPSGIAEWAKHRLEWLCDALQLDRKSMPHRSSYERILEQVVSWEELEQLVSRILSGKRYFGKQVLVAIDGKVLRGTLDEKQEGVYLLAAYLPEEGIVLMEVAVKGKGQELDAAAIRAVLPYSSCVVTLAPNARSCRTRSTSTCSEEKMVSHNKTP